MISTVIRLARTSLLSLLFLSAALLTLVSVLADPPAEPAGNGPDLAASLASVPKPRGQTSEGATALRVALFDPERRPETVAGSIDDLRGLATPPPAPANVVLSGVLIDGHTARAMLNVIGGPAGWSAVGAEVGGWRVASIDAAGAVLEHDGRSLALKVADRWKTRGQPHADAATPGAAPAPDTFGGPGSADTLTPPDPVGAAPP